MLVAVLCSFSCDWFHLCQMKCLLLFALGHCWLTQCQRWEENCVCGPVRFLTFKTEGQRTIIHTCSGEVVLLVSPTGSLKHSYHKSKRTWQWTTWLAPDWPPPNRCKLSLSLSFVSRFEYVHVWMSMRAQIEVKASSEWRSRWGAVHVSQVYN